MSFVQIKFLQTEGFRLSAIYAGVFVLSVTVLGAIVLVITGQAFRDQIVQFSRVDIAAVRDGYRSEGMPEAREVISQRMAAPAASDFFLLQKNGGRVAGNLPPMAARTGITELVLPGSRILGVGEYLGPGLYVFSGSDLSRLDSVHARILHVLIWLFGGALVLAVLGGALVSRSFLRRTDAMTRACRAIMDGNLKTRIPIRGAQDELDRLAITINEMLSRIASLMENLRQVTNDIAHDLRTPVTHLRHRLERARGDSTTVAEYDEALKTATAKADEILALFAALLRIAQIEGGARRAAFAHVDLRALLQQLGDIYGAVAEDCGHRMVIENPPTMHIRGDRQLLVQLFSNLIENAIVHTPPGTEVRVTVAMADDTVTVIVNDTGPGVPAEEHDKLFRRLYRREASRTTPGYGLGLALAAAVAELHGAKIHIGEAASGFSVSVSFAVA